MSVTIRDIAKRLDLSHTTISRVLNNRYDLNIPENTRERVMAMAKEMGYRPNRIARALAVGSTHMIAFGAENCALNQSFFAMNTRYARQMLKEAGFEIQIVESRDILRGASWPLEGVMAFDCPSFAEEAMRMGAIQGVPVVSMGSFSVTEMSDYVNIDLHDAAVEAVSYLVQSGRKRIVQIFHQFNLNHPSDRRRAYTEVMDRAGLPHKQLSLDCADWDSERMGARVTVREYLREHQVDAFFCFNDEIALGAYRGARDVGMRVPDDVAIVGCDGIEDTEYTDPEISTIVQPIEEMCSVAWTFLHNRLTNPDIPQQRAILKPRLELRGSSA